LGIYICCSVIIDIRFYYLISFYSILSLFLLYCSFVYEEYLLTSYTKKFPRLKRLARKILSIPATSSGTERLFSYSGIILNSRRQRLSPDQIDNMLIIRSARKILPNIKQVDWKNYFFLIYFVGNVFGRKKWNVINV